MGEEAQNRLGRFEAFVKDKTQKDEAEAKTALDAYVSKLRTSQVSHLALSKARSFLQDELANEDLADSVRSYGIRARWRLRAILRSQGPGDLEVPSLDDVGLGKAIEALEGRALSILAGEQSDERKALRAELAELQDRRWLGTLQADVLAEITRRKEIGALQIALKDTAHSAITAKNTALSKILVSERLRARFTKEIDHLKLAGLAIELTQMQSKDGISRFKLSLAQSKSKNAGDILSEGEYRCVALAGFLAELATNDGASGIIFDDPVSSLDHLHRETIAKRLAEEGRKRQVIVFTHDLPFLFLLRYACIQVDEPAHKTEIALRHIQKRIDGPGYCHNHAPDKAQNADARVQSLRKHLTNTQTLYDNNPDGVDWLITARGIVDSLRQAWEAAIEDAISPVLRTFASKVDTKGFLKLSAITEQDALTMRKHYGQLSALLHKASDHINPAAPSPATITAEIEALEAWLQDISDRQAQIKAA